MPRKYRVLIRWSLLTVGVLVVCWLVQRTSEHYRLNLLLQEAVRRNDPAQVEALVKAGADPNAHPTRSVHFSLRQLLALFHRQKATSAPPPALLLALDWQDEADDFPPENLTLIRSLLKAGAKVNVVNSQGEPPLLIAIKSNKPETARLLLQYGADANGQTRDHVTALMTAVAAGDAGLAKLLVAKGAKVNAQDSRGDTAAMYAVNANSLPCLRFLREQHADFSCKDRSGATAFSMAHLTNDAAIIKLLGP